MPKMEVIWDNLLALSVASASSGDTASTSFAATKMLTENPSDVFRSAKNAPHKRWFRVGAGDRSLDIDRLVLVNHNMIPGASQYRVLLSVNDADTDVQLETVVPASLSGGGYTGAATDIDEGFSDVGTDKVYSSTPGVAWGVTVRFNSPSGGTPLAGTDLQAFWISVEYNTLPAPGPAQAQLVSAYLAENSVVKRFLGYKTIYSSAGGRIWLYWTWNASEVSDYSKVDLVLAFQQGPGAFGGGNGVVDVNLHNAVWHCEHANNTLQNHRSSVLGDSGWVDYNPTLQVAGSILPETKLPRRDLDVVLDNGGFAFYRVYVLIRADNAPTVESDINLGASFAQVPFDYQGYIEVGTAIVGAAWSPTVGVPPGAVSKVTLNDYKGRTGGSVMFGLRHPPWRELSVQLNFLTPAEKELIQDRIRRNGALKPYWMSLIPRDATEGASVSMFAAMRMAEYPATFDHLSNYDNTNDVGRRMSLEAEEVL